MSLLGEPAANAGLLSISGSVKRPTPPIRDFFRKSRRVLFFIIILLKMKNQKLNSKNITIQINIDI
jgi:hypothetical protein